MPVLIFFIWNSFLLQPLDNFPDNRLDLIHLFLRSDHRIHQRQISISTCPENRTKLCLKHPLSVKAETDSSVSHDWIRLIRNVQVFCLFISSQVCSTDHCQPVTHRLRNFLICQKQFILTRIILSSKILKLTSQKPNSCSAIIKNTVLNHPCFRYWHRFSILLPSFVTSGSSLNFQEFFPFFHIGLPADLIFFSYFFIRINIQTSCISVHNPLLSIPF